jgi:PAS domain S-box-containing protein
MTTESNAGSDHVRGVEIAASDTRERYREKIARITLDSMVQFVGLLDATGTVLEINKVALDAVGITLADVEGKPFWETFWWQVSDEVNATLRQQIARAARGEFVRWDTPIYGRAGGRETIIIDGSLMPVTDANGQVVFIAAEGRDITEKKAYEREIARQREELAELDQLKTQFFANISHEFRTPLSLMMGPLEDVLAAPEGLSPEHRERLELAHRNALRQLKLVNTLLEFSRIEAGRIEASFEPTDLSILTAELASIFRAAIERAGITLIVDCPPLPEPVFVDRGMWEKLVLNLLSNAFKFTFAGEIEVSLRAVGQAARLTVRDTGTGIPTDELPRLFERFHRVKHARGRSFEGSGIGLALVKELARLHGGDVSVESALGKGSAFLITVPLGSAHLPASRLATPGGQGSPRAVPEAFVQEALRWTPAAHEQPSTYVTAVPPDVGRVAAAAADRAPEPHGGAHIIVADDNRDMREYIQRLLTGYDVVAVADGQAALRAARERRPDLMLTDVMMPEVDGLELLREFRADPNLSVVPVILLSARAGEESRIEGLEAGADEYLVKPFSARELLACVRAQLRLAESRQLSREALLASEQRYRALVTASSDVVFRMNADWSVMYPLDGRSLVASNSAPVVGWMEKNIPAFEHARVRAAIAAAVSTGQTFELEHQVIRADGSCGWTHSRAVPIVDDAGTIVEWFGTASDVSRRKQAEGDLKDIRSRMEAALEAGAIGTWAWSVQADRFSGDASLAHIFGVAPEVVAGGPLAGIIDAIHPDDRERVGALVRDAESGDRYEADYRVTRPDGSIRWVTARGQVERDADGTAVRFPGVVIDVTDRKLAEAALHRVTAESERMRRLYETVLSATPDFIYVFSLDHRVLYANESLIRMWGRGREGAIGKTFLEIGYEPWHAEMHDREIDQVRATREPIRGEVPFTGTHGRRIYDYIFVPVIGADGEVEAVAGTTRDVTDRKEAELTLSDSDRKKDEFIALLAHELRNPLAPIRNGLQVVRRARDEAVRERAQDMMDRQLAHMVRLIDDLLDVSRISRNKLELRRAPVALADVVESAVEAAQPAIEAAGHELLVSLPTRPVRLEADLTRLAQVLSNLLTNSAKYTERGGTIWLSAERRAGVIEVTVTDTGIGIPRESLPRIFDMFSQVDRSIERSTGGLGIGLALVKGLTEMHGGEVVATSDGEGRGSTFTVTLPVIPDEGAVADDDTRRTPQKSPARRVLVVDDSRDGAESLGMMLELSGHDVALAHDGYEAIERAEQFRPDVILMDVGMPRLNGLEATRQIRQQPWGKTATIIALTGWGQECDREQSRAAGCNGHLVKPVALDVLHQILAATPPEP